MPFSDENIIIYKSDCSESQNFFLSPQRPPPPKTSPPIPQPKVLLKMQNIPTIKDYTSF